MRSFIRAVAAVVLLVSAGLSQEAPAPASPAPFFDRKYDPAANPFKQLEAARAEAKKTGRQILLDIGGEWCIWCHRLDDLFRANPDLADLLTKHYVIVKINVSMDNKNEIFMGQYPKVPGYPHLFVLDAGGKLVHSQDTGALEEGKGHSKEKIAEFLKKWAKS